jgi:hypothetical protein
MGVGMPPMLQPKATARVRACGRLVALSLSRMRGRSTCTTQDVKLYAHSRVGEEMASARNIYHDHEHGSYNVVQGHRKNEARHHHSTQEAQRIRTGARKHFPSKQAVNLKFLKRTAETETAEHEEDVGLAKVRQIKVGQLLARAGSYAQHYGDERHGYGGYPYRNRLQHIQIVRGMARAGCRKYLAGP